MAINFEFSIMKLYRLFPYKMPEKAKKRFKLIHRTSYKESTIVFGYLPLPSKQVISDCCSIKMITLIFQLFLIPLAKRGILAVFLALLISPCWNDNLYSLTDMLFFVYEV